MPHRWTKAALTRKDQIESGLDITFNEVFKPIFLEFAKSHRELPCLEIGAGTGHLALEASKFPSELTAIEPSRGMYEIAKLVLDESPVRLINCSLADLPHDVKYGLAFSHLVAHCVGDLPAFLRDVALRLQAGASFLFSIPHPCFFNSYKNLWADDFCYMAPLTKEISFTITRDPNTVIAGVPYHHRPLSSYVNAVISAGFSLDRFEEIFPPVEIQEKYGKLWETPRYCTFQCRRC